MVRTQTPICDFGAKAPDFELLATDNNKYKLQDLMGESGLLIMFICNHCPYVKAILDKIIRDVQELKSLGVNSVAIMSNDPSEYAEDSFENMQKLTLEKELPFYYLLDETQEVAKKFGAVCTPDFFGYNNKFELQYRGRLDESRKESITGARRDLFLAMAEVAETGKGPAEQVPSMGCSIKWKN
jgi:peroxiredoxin